MIIGINEDIIRHNKGSGSKRKKGFEIKNSDHYGRIHKSEPLQVAQGISTMYFSLTKITTYRPKQNIS